MPEEGLSAKESGLGHSEHVEERLKVLATQEGHPMVLPDLVPKTHRALVMGELARDLGTEKHREVHLAIFDAYFGEGRDIGAREVLLDVARAQGLDELEVTTAWRSGTYDKRLQEFSHLATHLDIHTTPAASSATNLSSHAPVRGAA